MAALSRVLLALLSVPLTCYICNHVQTHPTDLIFAVVCVVSGVLLFLFALLLRPASTYDWAGHLLLNLRCTRHPSLRMYAGQEEAFIKQAQYLQWRQIPEEIWLTAVRHPDGVVYATERPGRHHHCIELMGDCARAGGANCSDQGFVTTHGRYVGREEALSIATQAGQLITKTPPPSQLFSEDLWAGPVQSQRDLELKAQELVHEALNSCKVVTIETVARKPLAVGFYDMIPTVRDSLAVVCWRMDQERQAKAAAVVLSPESNLDASKPTAQIAGVQRDGG